MQVFEQIEGKPVAFNRLTRRQCMDITAKVWDAKRRATLQDLNDAGASPTERLAALAELRKAEGGHGILIDHLRTAAGTDEVLALGLAGNSGGHTVETINLGIERSIVLAMRLCGYEPIETPDTPEGDAKPEDDDTDGFPTPSGKPAGTG